MSRKRHAGSVTTRTFTFAITGTLTVDDVDLKTSLLGLEFVPEPGVDIEVTDEIRGVLQEQLLGVTDRLSPDDRLRVFFSAGPYEAVRAVLERWVTGKLPRARLEVDHGVDVRWS